MPNGVPSSRAVGSSVLGVVNGALYAFRLEDGEAQVVPLHPPGAAAILAERVPYDSFSAEQDAALIGERRGFTRRGEGCACSSAPRPHGAATWSLAAGCACLAVSAAFARRRPRRRFLCQFAQP